MPKKLKIAVFDSHPIQYHYQYFQQLACKSSLELTVFFGHDTRQGVNDPAYGQIKWDLPLLEGYHFEFLKNWSPKPGFSFFGMINPKLILRILHGSYDVVWIWGYSYLTCWLALIAAKLSGTHVLLRGEGVLSQPLSPFRKLLKKFIVGTYLKFVDGVAYSCEKNRQYYLSFGVSPQKLFFVPCAIDNKRFFNDAQNSDWQKVRHEFGFSENDFVILFVGKFAPVKRVKDLIQAIALTSNTDLKLLLVGTGYLRESLEALAMQDVPGQVKFAGFRNQSELPAFYSAADALAIASENDPSPKVVNEAMAMGLPVICSDRVGTVGDLVIHDQTGLVFPMGDIHQLAECIKQLASDREKANAIGQNAGLLIRDWSYEAGHKEIMHWIKNSVNDRQEAN